MKVTALPWLMVTAAGLKVAEPVAVTAVELMGGGVGVGVGLKAVVGDMMSLVQAKGSKAESPKTPQNKTKKSLFITASLKRLDEI
jgi:hypothetical protein